MTQSEFLPATPTPTGIIQRISIRFGGSKAKELERFLKFAVVGVIGAIIDLGVTNLLLATILKPTPENITPSLIAASIGFTLAVTSNFIWNRYWTYPDSRSTPLPKQIAQFFVVNLVGLGIRGLVVRFFTNPFGTIIEQEAHQFFPSLIMASDTPTKLGTNAAILLALVIVMLWNFFVNRRWTYGDVK